MYGEMAGASLPDFLPGVFALMITATIAGVGKVRVGCTRQAAAEWHMRFWVWPAVSKPRGCGALPPRCLHCPHCLLCGC
jgi:hypothetical protein